MTTRIHGKVLFPATAPAADARMYLRIVEVGRADAPASLVTEDVLDGISAGPEAISYSIYVESMEPSGKHALQVLIDLDGDGRVGTGDYISTRAYPVRLDGSVQTIDVNVHLVS